MHPVVNCNWNVWWTKCSLLIYSRAKEWLVKSFLLLESIWFSSLFAWSLRFSTPVDSIQKRKPSRSTLPRGWPSTIFIWRTSRLSRAPARRQPSTIPRFSPSHLTFIQSAPVNLFCLQAGLHCWQEMIASPRNWLRITEFSPLFVNRLIGRLKMLRSSSVRVNWSAWKS